MPFFRNPTSSFRKRNKKVPRTPYTTTKTMSSEIARLLDTQPDPAARKGFETEMSSFMQTFSRYQSNKEHGIELDWDKIRPPPAEQLIPYESLKSEADLKGFSKLAILKVNGGLGTSMGMKGAKSALEVKNGLTFLDLTVQQVQHLNTTMRTDVPLILMTSFQTQTDTIRVIKKYVNHPVRILTFNQSRYPRILKESLLPCPKHAEDESRAWYPPGHGDIYTSLRRSGILEQLLSEGKEYLFISNSDNLGAIADPVILQHMIESESDFIMEVTNKTKSDLKGGTLVDYDGSLRLLELGQVPHEHVEDFKSVFNFKIFNTNNLWVNLKALKRILDGEGMDLDIIEKTRYTDNGKGVIQLETAAGSAVKHFKQAHGIIVPRRRFIPVKNCADLLLVMSDIYRVENGHLVFNTHRPFQNTPTIKLSDDFKSIEQFHARFKTIPSIADLDLLTVTGDVYFGRACDLRGTVIVAATEGQRIDIPDGSILENRLLAGNLNMIVSISERTYKIYSLNNSLYM
ncbi:UTP-glucose-1-phosphate uridylyltransferase [Rhodocollybia butyracea]|uniref:UTP--glucose-1-phosphate uridylyltransferase n=1 Tax=Rhodocollybia butyracea TaxID=206335 RepID=A0A9P5U0C7_9AGAR|nr:UTP-glucose-1-phosphate uridylyltransferase [Rhodocollybia butyracea]